MKILVLQTLIFLSLLCCSYANDEEAKLKEMNIIEKYEYFVENEKWNDAIPVIKEIIQRNPKIDSSWFNYGVCLEGIKDYSGATEAFIKAHELNIKDYGIHYRIIRSMYLSEDYNQLFEFIDYLCQTFKEEIDIFFENEEFKKIHKLDKYIELKKKYYKGDL